MELNPDDMKAVTLRLKRAHGHLASVIKMLEEGADCEAVLTQLAAVNKAISRGGYAIVATGLEQCLAADNGAGEVDAKKIEKLFLALA
ncbi:MAG TPA: metal-sensitive transcriptional regulator [Trebonia sp.]